MTATVRIDGKADGAVSALDDTARAAEDAQRELGQANTSARGAARGLDETTQAAEGTTRAQRRMRQQVDESADALDDLTKSAVDADKATTGLGDSSAGLSGVLGGGGRGSLLATAGLAGAALGGATLAVGALRGAMDAAWESTERFFQSQGREDLWESAERSARRYTGTLFTLLTGTEDADDAHRRLIEGLDAGYVVVDTMADAVRPLAGLLRTVLVGAMQAAGTAAQIATGNFDSLERELEQVETQAQRTARAAQTLTSALDTAMASTLVGQIAGLTSEIEAVERATAEAYAVAQAERNRMTSPEEIRQYVDLVSGMVLGVEHGTRRLRVQTEAGYQTLRVSADELTTMAELLDQQQRNGVSLLDLQIERQERLSELERQRDERRRRADTETPGPIEPAAVGRGAPADAPGPLLGGSLRLAQAALDAISAQVDAYMAQASAVIEEAQAKRARISESVQAGKLREIEITAAANAEMMRMEEQAAADRLRIIEQLAESTGAAFQQAANAAALSFGSGVEESADRSRRVMGGLAADLLDILARTTLATAGVTSIFDVFSGGLPNPGKALAMVGAAGALRAASSLVRGIAGAPGGAGAGGGSVQPASASAPLSSTSVDRSVSTNIVNQFGVVGDARAVAGVVADSVRYAQREGML